MKTPFLLPVLIYMLSVNRQVILAQTDDKSGLQHFVQAEQYVADHEFDAAITIYSDAAQQFMELKDYDQALHCQLMKCDLLINQGQFQKADELLDTCKDLATQVSAIRHNEYQVKMILLDQRLPQSDSNKIQQLKSAERLIRSDSTIEKNFGASVYQLIGNYYFDHEQYDSCNTYMQWALGELSTKVTQEMEGDVCLFWARSLRRIGDLQKAINLINRAVSVYVKVLGANHTKVATGYNDLAIVQNLYGDLVGSGNSFSRALKIRENLFGRHTNEFATVLNNATLYYLEINQYERALSYAKETIGVFETIQNPDKRFHVASYNTLAKVYETMGELELAKLNFQKSISLHQKYFPGNARIRFYYIDLGKNAMLRKNYQEALTNFHLAMSMAIPGIDADSLSQNPSSQDPSNYLTLKTLCLLKARAYHEDYHQSGDTSQLSEAINLYHLADVFATKNRTEVQYQKSRIAFSKKNVDLYENAIQAYLEMWQQSGKEKYLESAFILSEKSKSLTLLEDLLEVNALLSSNLPEHVLRQEKNIQDSLLYYREKLIEAIQKDDKSEQDRIKGTIFNLDLQFDEFKKNIENNFPDFYKSKYGFDFLSPRAIQKDLKADHTLIEYFVGEQNVFAFVATPTKIDCQILDKPDSLDIWVTGLLNSLQSFDFSKPVSDSFNLIKTERYINSANNLYQLLWSPFMEDLTKCVVVVPDGILNYLPFGVLLQEPPGAKTTYKEFNYLENDFTISYNYSATLGHQMVESQLTNNKKFLVIAPDFSTKVRSDAGKLLFNQGEANEIAKIVHSDLFTGQEANKNSFKKEYHKYGSFHFATHAIVNEESADYSFLSFQDNGNEAEERLYLQELYAMKIPAQVVTLSACQTNVGPLLQGEGIASLAKGFSYAGAKSIITSMWDVD
ncbi:MAG: CHAT domain-containing protein, partial [Saprospiraceae bacterium]|nr:CHAT domain-containing protein [Saprospiraceae bacterium]